MGGAIVTGTETFTAAATTENRDCLFTFDASSLDRKSVVVFLELFLMAALLPPMNRLMIGMRL